MSPYLKFAMQVLATITAAVVAALQTGGPLTATTWTNVVIIGLGAVAVLGAGELPAGVWAHTKPIISAAVAGVVVIQSSLHSGLDTATILQAILAALGTFGIVAVPGPVLQQQGLKTGLVIRPPAGAELARRGRHEEY